MGVVPEWFFPPPILFSFTAITCLNLTSQGLYETPQRVSRHTSARYINVLHYVNLGVAIGALLAIIVLIFLATVGLNNTQSGA